MHYPSWKKVSKLQTRQIANDLLFQLTDFVIFWGQVMATFQYLPGGFLKKGGERLFPEPGLLGQMVMVLN